LDTASSAIAVARQNLKRRRKRKEMRQIGTTGKIGIADMRELPVGPIARQMLDAVIPGHSVAMRACPPSTSATALA